MASTPGSLSSTARGVLARRGWGRVSVISLFESDLKAIRVSVASEDDALSCDFNPLRVVLAIVLAEESVVVGTRDRVRLRV